MIKYFKYMFVAAIAMIAATGCQEDWEDTFSKAPTAPVLVNNGNILMTENTMSEVVTWTWSAARFLQGEVSYALYAEYGEATPVQLGSTTKDLSISMPKTELRTLLTGISGVPNNDSFGVNFYVIATDETGEAYTSDKQSVTIYAYGDAVSPVIALEATELVLDVTNPTGEVALLTWTPARLKYNEFITYNVYASYGEGEAIEAAKELTGTSYSLTVDALNELVVSTGAPEAATSEITFVVKAFSEGYPEGVPSAAAKMNITTYIASYPETVWLPGSYQGWDPATAAKINQSSLTKGLYEAFVNLTTEDGSDVEFKFTPTEGGWDSDWGLAEDASVTTDENGNVVLEVATVDMEGEKNIKVPSGIYRISMNKKLNKLTMIKVESIGLIGSATAGGWDTETPMEYDVNSNEYSTVTTLTNAGEYKFRVNNNWTYSIGSDGTFAGGNYTFEKETGEYKVVLDVNTHPYGVKVLSTSYPENLYVPGAHQGWDISKAPALQGDGEGHYEGAMNLVNSDASNTDCAWKFSPEQAWGKDFAGTIELDENGYGEGTYGGEGDIITPNGYYYITVDMTKATFTLRRIDAVGLVGTINSWGGDASAPTDAVFTYDADKNVWTLTQELAATDQVKVRFNYSWDYNRGAGGETEPYVMPNGTAVASYHNGKNLSVSEDGTYTITLDMSTNPNTITFNKQ